MDYKIITLIDFDKIKVNELVLVIRTDDDREIMFRVVERSPSECLVFRHDYIIGKGIYALEGVEVGVLNKTKPKVRDFFISGEINQEWIV